MSSGGKKALSAPIAPQKPHQVAFGAVEGENRGEKPFLPLRYRDDPWFWLRDDERKNEEVLSHLRSENAYTEQETAHLGQFKQKLYDEHISHLKETDDAPPYPYGDYFYYTKTKKGLSYKIHCRKKCGSLEAFAGAAEEVVLDENKVAEGHSQCVIRGVRPTPGHGAIAYSVDFKGDETYTVNVVDLATGETSTDNVGNVAGSIQWGRDEGSFYYLSQDHAKRPYKLWRHAVGTPQSEDKCLFTEEDDVFSLGLGKSKDGKYLFLGSGSSETSEIGMVDLLARGGGDGDDEYVVIQPRVKGLRYDVEHREGQLFVWTNKDGAINNRLMVTSVDAPAMEHWTEVIPYDPTRKIDEVEVFSTFLAIEGRQDGLTQLWTVGVTGAGVVDPATFKRVEFPEAMYECALSTNKVYETTAVRVYYSSLTTPDMWQDYDVVTGEFRLVKQKECLNFDSDAYVCKRAWAKADDGTMVPMSMVHRKDVDIDGPAPTPTMLYAYGSYGVCIDPCFHRMILPYLDRGMLYVIAHIRGGGEMGRYWYEEQGKYLNKRNTFSDFINCAEHLVDTGVTAPEKLAIEGRSAGGLLMGAVLNMRPDLFKIAISGVPFVDCVNTMCDPSIPLTTGEWEEWGNPNEAKYFDYMLSYSPYDNVRAQPYPNILITSGLYDPRVAYWEPTKWISKLRTMKTDENSILMKMELDAGHFSASDRYKYIREKSFEQSVVMDHLGLVDEDCK
jgi:oligopeptidase B